MTIPSWRSKTFSSSPKATGGVQGKPRRDSNRHFLAYVLVECTKVYTVTVIIMATVAARPRELRKYYLFLCALREHVKRVDISTGIIMCMQQILGYYQSI